MPIADLEDNRNMYETDLEFVRQFRNANML